MKRRKRTRNKIGPWNNPWMPMRSMIEKTIIKLSNHIRNIPNWQAEVHNSLVCNKWKEQG